jgi:hypothetical protein
MKIDEQAFLAALSYDPYTGIFTWKIDRPGRWKIKAGDRAGSSLVDNSGKTYRRICFNHVYVKEHRLAFLFMEGEMPPDDVEVDHDDGNGENNKWDNIRKVSRKDNAKNLRKCSRNTSGVPGVSWDKTNGKWSARIGKIFVGRFTNFDDAVKARKEAEIQYNYHKNHGSVRPL